MLSFRESNSFFFIRIKRASENNRFFDVSDGNIGKWSFLLFIALAANYALRPVIPGLDRIQVRAFTGKNNTFSRLA